MKKALLILNILVIALPSQAQQDKQDMKKAIFPQFFVAGGPAFSFISGGESWKGLLVGGHVGVGFNIDPGMKDYIRYQGEVNWCMMGSKYDEGYNLKGSVRLSYINVPLLIQHKTKKGLFVEGGVQPGFLLSAKDKYGGNTYDFKDQVKSFHFAIPLGIGFVFVNAVGVSLRYAHGLSNINKDGNEKDYNRVFAVRIFWIPAFNK